MKTLLVTGFDPFGGETINPSWQAVRSLPDLIGDWRIERMELPTVFGKASQMALNGAKNADAVLCIGQAGGRNAVTPEYVAINLRHTQSTDNEGNSPKDEPVVADAPSAYFSALPVRKMAEAIEQKGIASKVSYSAGTFVCNDLLFTLLHAGVDAAFIHVPYIPEQGKEPSMPLETIIKALTAAISVLP